MLLIDNSTSLINNSYKSWAHISIGALHLPYCVFLVSYYSQSQYKSNFDVLWCTYRSHILLMPTTKCTIFYDQSIFHQPKTAVRVLNTYIFAHNRQLFGRCRFPSKTRANIFPHKQQSIYTHYIRYEMSAPHVVQRLGGPLSTTPFRIYPLCGVAAAAVAMSSSAGNIPCSLYALYYTIVYSGSPPVKWKWLCARSPAAQSPSRLPSSYSCWCLSCFDMYNCLPSPTYLELYNTIHANWRHILLFVCSRECPV